MQLGQTGLGTKGEAELESWLKRVDDIQNAVKYILSEKKEDEEEEEPVTPTNAVDRRLRYQSDYSRFENDAFIAELEEKVDKPKQPKQPKTQKGLTEKLCKEEAERFKERGNTAFKEGDFAAAIEHYTSGIALDAANHALRNNRAMALLKERRWEEAIEDCNEVLQAGNDPRNVKALQRRAVALGHLHRSAEACEDLKLALRYDSRNKEAQLQLEKARKEAREEAKVKATGTEGLLSEVAKATGAVREAFEALRKEQGVEVPHSPGDEVEVLEVDPKELCEALCTLRVVLNADVASIYFRWIEGVELLCTLFTALRCELLTAVQRGPKGSRYVPTLIILLELMTKVLDNPYNLETFADDYVAQRRKALREAQKAREALEKAQRAFAEKEKAKKDEEREGKNEGEVGAVAKLPEGGVVESVDDNVLSLIIQAAQSEKARTASVSAIVLFATMTRSSDMREWLLEVLTVDEFLRFPHHSSASSDGALSWLLQIVDNLLLCPQWQARFACVPLPQAVLPHLAPNRSRSVRDAAAGCTMRLTTDPRFRSQLVEGNETPAPPTTISPRTFGGAWMPPKQVVGYLVERCKEEIAVGDTGGITMPSPFAVEAYLATFYNLTLDPAISTTVVDELISSKALLTCIDLLRPSPPPISRSDPHINIKARSLGLLVKCIPRPEVQAALLRHHDAVSLIAQFLTLDDAVPDEESDEVKEYCATCTEHAVSMFAVLLALEEKSMGEGVVEVTEENEVLFTTERMSQQILGMPGIFPTLKRCLRSANDRTSGNAALVLSKLAAQATLQEMGKEGMVDELLDTIIRKRRAMQEEAEFRQERRKAGEKVDDRPIEEVMRLNTLVQKNCAITLAKLAKDPANLAVLRARQGMEILASTLQYVDKAKGSSRP